MNSHINHRILLVLAGHAIDEVRRQFGDFDTLLSAPFKHLGLSSSALSILPICDGPPFDPPLDITAYRGVVISGSAAMVADASPFIGHTEALILKCLEHSIPLLGICFGHQLLAKVLGAEVGPHLKGRHNGTYQVHQLHSDRLFRDMPQDFLAQVSHRDVILKPASAMQILATTDYDPYHAFRYRDHAWGVQFHPEWNQAISHAYLLARASVIDQKSINLLAPSDDAALVFKNFLDIVRTTP